MVKAASLTIKKKYWFPILAPQELGGERIGESYLSDPQEGVGRTVSASILTVTGDPSKQSLHIDFKITGVDKNTLRTEVTGFNIITSAARKMMRRGKEKIEDSFVVSTKDKKHVRVKPILITKNKTTGAVLQNLRHHLRAHVIKLVGDLTYVEFVNSLIAHRVQKQLQDILRKVYPLTVCEIRWMGIEPEGVPIKESVPPPLATSKNEEEQEVVEASA